MKTRSERFRFENTTTMGVRTFDNNSTTFALSHKPHINNGASERFTQACTSEIGELILKKTSSTGVYWRPPRTLSRSAASPPRCHCDKRRPSRTFDWKKIERGPCTDSRSHATRSSRWSINVSFGGSRRRCRLHSALHTKRERSGYLNHYELAVCYKLSPQSCDFSFLFFENFPCASCSSQLTVYLLVRDDLSSHPCAAVMTFRCPNLPRVLSHIHMHSMMKTESITNAKHTDQEIFTKLIAFDFVVHD